MTYKTHRQREEVIDARLQSIGLCSGIFDCDCACASPPPPPNYQPVADASKESAEIMAQLGREQLDEAKRQYDMTQTVSQPVVDAQLSILDQTNDQGGEYYDYMKSTFRPIEGGLAAEAGDAGSAALQEEAAGRAIADTRSGATGAVNMMIRQGLRYGISPAATVAKMGAASTDLASAGVAAGNAAREREKTTGWARKMDVAGIGRNLPGASQGAYSLAVGAGNSAVGNAQAPGQALLNGMSQGGNTIGAGRSMAMQGALGVLGAQSSYNNTLANVAMANAQMQSNGDSLGGMIGQGIGAYLGTASDRRLKENIELVGKDERTGFNLYEFNYIDDDARYRGVMADEVESVMPDAVHYNDLGFASVDYDMLGLKMEEV